MMFSSPNGWPGNTRSCPQSATFAAMLQVSNLSVHFGDRALFDGITLQVGEQERIGLAGRNGAGKSTLLKIIAGLHTNYEGQVQVPKEYTIGYLRQELDSASEKSVREETATAFDDLKQLQQRVDELTDQIAHHHDYESDDYAQLVEELTNVSHRVEIFGADKADKLLERVLTGLGFLHSQLDAPLNTFSGGWQMRVELAKLLLRQPDLLLLDEPTNHLDIESIIWLEGFLQEYPGSIMLVSHDKRLLDNLTKRTIEIELGKMYDYKANYSNYLLQRAERREKLIAEKKNQDRQIKHTEQLIDKFRAKANKASFAQSLIKKLDKMERIEIEDVDTAGMKLQFPEPPRSGRVVVEVHNLHKSYGDNHVLRGIDFQCEKGDKIAFVGKNGEGKTTLGKILAGQETYQKGEVKLGHNVSLGYFAQHQAELMAGDDTILETVENKATGDMRSRVRSLLGAFLFSGDDVYKKTKVLSGGEKARLALACLLLDPINLLILDEPTNHLDMVSKDILKQAIQAYAGTVIIVSHDREFLDGLTDKVYEFKGGRLKEYLGDIEYFLYKIKVESLDDLKGQQPATAKAVTATSDNKLSYEARKERDRKERKLKNRVSKLERQISEQEAKLKEMEAEIHQPDFYDKAKDPTKIFNEYNRQKQHLEQLMEDWTSAQMALEELAEKG